VIPVRSRKFQFVSVEEQPCQPGRRSDLFESVNAVSGNRRAYGVEMDSYLMGSASVRSHFQESVASELF